MTQIDILQIKFTTNEINGAMFCNFRIPERLLFGFFRKNFKFFASDWVNLMNKNASKDVNKNL